MKKGEIMANGYSGSRKIHFFFEVFFKHEIGGNPVVCSMAIREGCNKVEIEALTEQRKEEGGGGCGGMRESAINVLIETSLFPLPFPYTDGGKM